MASERKRQETQLAHGLGYVPGVTDDGVTGRLADVEVLFKSVVKSWSEYSIDLVRLLFTGTSLNSSGVHKEASMNFRSELSSGDPTASAPTTPLEVAMVHEAHSRHGGIVTKTVAALLLLLLKHFNLNHTYQAEFVTAKLVQAKCIIVAIKALNKPDIIDHYCRSLDRSDILEVLVPPQNRLSATSETGGDNGGVDQGGDGSPAKSGVRETAGHDTTTMKGGDSGGAARDTIRRGGGISDEPGTPAAPPAAKHRVTNRRHVQTALSLLQLLQKVTKGKHYRIIQLVHTKSIEILKPLLRIQHGAMQLYTLKLIKSQVPYFTRQWKKNNQRIVSSIDLKVRHHILDPWFYVQVEEPSDTSHDEEEVLRESVSRFVQEYYPTEPDALSEILQATSIFDLYQGSVW